MQYQLQELPVHMNETISVSLCNQNLWHQFHGITNEMIVTKVGRRMFPIICVSVTGLDPDKMYTVELSFEQMNSHRWRYLSGEWQIGLKPDPPVHCAPYQHPDSPNYGRTWMKEPISFSKVKLTNKHDRMSSCQVLLNSLHKYMPRISIIDVLSKRKIFETAFTETEFIAVTAYQNDDVKALKIRHNPFAKAFLDPSSTKQDEPNTSMPMFYSQESSSGGPERLKLPSYRSSPYAHSPQQHKSSSSPTSAFHTTGIPFGGAYASAAPAISDATAYYANVNYPPPDSYYYSYDPSSSMAYFPFTYPTNDYHSNLTSTPFAHFQQPFHSAFYNGHYSLSQPTTKTEIDEQ